MIHLDPRFRGGDYYDAEPGDGPWEGLAVARMVALPSCEALEVGERLIPLVYDELRRLFALPGRRIGHEHPEAHRLSTLEAIAQDAVLRMPRRLEERDVSVDDQASLSWWRWRRWRLQRCRRTSFSGSDHHDEQGKCGVKS